MCRSIKPLYNFEPQATEAEVRAAARQFVRKLSGFHEPSAANAAAFEHAVDHITDATAELLSSLTTKAAPRDREVVAAQAKDRFAKRQLHSHS